MTKEITISGLRKTHYQQLKDILAYSEHNAVYWGRKDYFDRRTMDLNIVLDNILKEFDK